MYCSNYADSLGGFLDALDADIKATLPLAGICTA